MEATRGTVKSSTYAATSAEVEHRKSDPNVS